MIEDIVISYLHSQELNGAKVPCYAERPEKVTTLPFLVVEKTGSTEENHLPEATIAVQSYAKTLYDASVLNNAVKRAMKKITQLPAVSAVRLNSDYNFTSATLKAYRYQAVFILTYYEEEQDV